MLICLSHVSELFPQVIGSRENTEINMPEAFVSMGSTSSVSLVCRCSQIHDSSGARYLNMYGTAVERTGE